MDISIITINYNNADGLRKTVQSVVSQKDCSFEYIIIDGFSSDSSVDVIESNSSCVDYWISEKDNGIYDAMNKGIKKAKGKYLMFLNSGDCLKDSNTINLCSQQILDNNADIFYGNILAVNHPTNPVFSRSYPSDLTISYFKADTLNHQASLIKADLFAEFGLYPTEYRLAADYWLYLVSCIAGKSFCYINHTLILYDINGLSAGDGFENYRIELNLIWERTVPKYVQQLADENEQNKQKLIDGLSVLDSRLLRPMLLIRSIVKRLKD